MTGRIARIVVAGLLAMTVLGACGGDSGPSLEISDPMVRVPPGPNTAAYFVVTNSGDEADTLVGVTASAGMAEIHETIMQNDVATMQPVTGGVEVPAGGEVDFEPGGLHIMLLDVPALAAGDMVTINLEWEKSGTLTIEAPVQDIEAGMDMG
jgi:copper(I)-binding protein